MGLFGALFAGVSGLDSQSNKIGIISNNISNVNTVGYKQGQADFDTLVVPSGGTSFSPGGVIGATQQLVAEQGVIAATTSPTDVAISGNGFFVVNTEANGSGQTLYTRNGSFTQDSQGNFVNSDGYYLQGLPIDATTGKAEQANAQNLKTVSINQSASGAATATTGMTLAANLDSTQAVLQGPGESRSININDLTNNQNTGTEIIAATTGSTGNGLSIGDTINIQTTGANGTSTNTFTYGGYATGRNVNTGAPATGDTTPTDTLISNASGTVTTGINTDGTDGLLTIDVGANAAHYAVGGTISISGVTGTVGGLTADQINGEWPITGKNGNVITFNVGTNSTSAVNGGGTAIVATNRTYPFTGTMLNATSASSDFLTNLTTNDFAPDALEFTIANSGTGVTSTFTYNSVPNTTQGQFNSLNTLAQAISNTSGLTASVVGGQLLVSATDANNGLTFANVDTTGNDGLPGINWTQELGLQNVAATPISGTGSAIMFNSLSGLSAQIDATASASLTSSVANATSSSPSLAIYSSNPLDTITFSDGTGNQGSSLLSELGFLGANNSALTQSGINGNGYAINTTGSLAATYDPENNAVNMSSGAVTPQYSKDITVYDAQGNSHTLALNFIKLNTNTWAAEVTAVPASDVLPASSDGQVAYGTLTFNGNGALVSATGTIASPQGFTVDWSNGATSSNIVADLGLGGSAGIIQTAGAYGFSTANQNGSPVGELTGVNVDSNGNVIASFSNGETQTVYQIPLASVANPDGMNSVSGDAYIQTIASGIANLQFAGTSGVGTFTPSALEQSNVDLSTQLTDLIVAQQAYGANSKLLTVADSLLQELDQIIQS